MVRYGKNSFDASGFPRARLLAALLLGAILAPTMAGASCNEGDMWPKDLLYTNSDKCNLFSNHYPYFTCEFGGGSIPVCEPDYFPLCGHVEFTCVSNTADRCVGHRARWLGDSSDVDISCANIFYEEGEVYDVTGLEARLCLDILTDMVRCFQYEEGETRPLPKGMEKMSPGQITLRKRILAANPDKKCQRISKQMKSNFDVAGFELMPPQNCSDNSEVN